MLYITWHLFMKLATIVVQLLEAVPFIHSLQMSIAKALIQALTNMCSIFL